MTRRKVTGAISGVVISGLIALAGWTLNMTSPAAGFGWLAVLGGIGLYGMPVALVLGWRLAPRVGQAGVVGLVMWMGVSAALLGVIAVVTPLAAGEVLAGDVLQGVLGWLPFAVIGLAYAFPVLALTMLAAAVWYLWMRALMSAGWPAGRHGAHVAETRMRAGVSRGRASNVPVR